MNALTAFTWVLCPCVLKPCIGPLSLPGCLCYHHVQTPLSTSFDSLQCATILNCLTLDFASSLSACVPDSIGVLDHCCLPDERSHFVDFALLPPFFLSHLGPLASAVTHTRTQKSILKHGFEHLADELDFGAQTCLDVSEAKLTTYWLHCVAYTKHTPMLWRNPGLTY